MDKMTMKVKVEHVDSAERVGQLEKIDKLREYGVGEEIKLPQVRAPMENIIFWIAVY